MNVPQRQKRAGHAVDCELFIFALTGSATLVHAVNNTEKIDYHLANDRGILVPAHHFIEMKNFSSNAVVVVYASKKFKDTNYYQLDQL